jgi:hypothetical protein
VLLVSHAVDRKDRVPDLICKHKWKNLDAPQRALLTLALQRSGHPLGHPDVPIRYQPVWLEIVSWRSALRLQSIAGGYWVAAQQRS